MIRYIKKKKEKHRIKRTFKEYGHTIKKFNLPLEGQVAYAQWLNPLERPKEITQSQVNFYNRFVKKGTFAIDIGAHTGDTTIPMALAAGAKGLVLALDPNPIVFKILEENSKLNTEKTRIVPLCAAATVDDGDFFYHSSEATYNNGGISETPVSYHGSFALPDKVRGINLDSYLRNEYQTLLPSLSLIKIDTEGYDAEVIQSISKIINEFRPVIITECFKRLKKQKRCALYDLIADNGYILNYMSDFEENSKIVKISRKEMSKWKHFDICAIPQEKISMLPG